MNAYIIREWHVDWDGWPMGDKHILFVTASEERAKEAVEKYRYGSVSGLMVGYETVVVEDT